MRNNTFWENILFRKYHSITKDSNSRRKFRHPRRHHQEMMEIWVEPKKFIYITSYMMQDKQNFWKLLSRKYQTVKYQKVEPEGNFIIEYISTTLVKELFSETCSPGDTVRYYPRNLSITQESSFVYRISQAKLSYFTLFVKI